MISAQYFTISSTEISAVLDYLFRFILVYISCFIGTILRDLITASKMNKKVDILNALLYSSPCAFIMATLYDLISDKAGFGVLVLACVFIGMWSREVTSLLLNNKVALGVIRFFVKTLLKNASNTLSDEEEKQLTDVFEDAVGTGKKTASDQKADENSVSAKEDSQNCITANSDPPKDTEPVDSGNQDENNFEEEEELGGDPEGEFSWTKIIGY